MVPLYAARIEDLGPGDFVQIKCIASGHDMLIPPSSLRHGLWLAPPTAGTASGRLASYRIDAQTGGLTPLRTQTVGQRPAAVLATRYG